MGEKRGRRLGVEKNERMGGQGGNEGEKEKKKCE